MTTIVKGEGMSVNKNSWTLTEMLTISGSIIRGPCVYGGIIVQPVGGAVAVTVYDSLTASGKRLPPNDYSVALSAGVWVLSFEEGMDIVNGIYIFVNAVSKVKYWLQYEV
jgi:hypothetical protein